MADKIVLRNMVFYGYHGAFAAERELGQKFEVDVEIHLDLTGISQNDDLEVAINHVDVYTLVKDVVEEGGFNLLESIAEAAALGILSACDVEGVTVRVRKVNAPLGGILDYVEAEVTRRV